MDKSQAKSILYAPLDQRKNDCKILSINCGSSSIKVSLFDNDNGIYNRLLDVYLKGINKEEFKLEVISSRGKESTVITKNVEIAEGLHFIFDVITRKFDFTFSSLQGIGHRFVHGGSRFLSTTRIDPKAINDLQKLSYLAPLHNDACFLGIKECLALGGSIPQVAVFDTAFHHSLPAVAANYAIRSDIALKYQIKRYGFHGIANAFLWSAYVENIRKDTQNAKIITLHLGNGCSMTAIEDGLSVDTSMGFTPAEGLIMATRAGDIDAAVVEFLCLHDKKEPNEIMKQLNFQSGLLGISETSSDMETLLGLSTENEKARLAVEMFCYRIVKYLGAYIAILGGADAIIFSGGIGENSPMIRDIIIAKMEWYGFKIDGDANQQAIGLPAGAVQKISTSASKIACYVIAADENIFIAKEVHRIVTLEKFL
jgi:acetate kinase